VHGARPAVVGGRAVALAGFFRASHSGALRAIVSGKTFPASPIFTVSPIDPDNPGDYATLNSHQPRDGTARIVRHMTDSSTAWPELPAKARATLMSLMKQLILDYAATTATPRAKEVSHDL
jgi:hypothetical protein